MQLPGIASLLLAVGLLPAAAQSLERSIPNALELSWPWDMTYVVVDSAQASTLRSVDVNGLRRPLQLERVGDKTRAWFVATLGKETSHPVRLDNTPAPAGISLREDGDHWLIDNGVYEFRLRKGRAFASPVPFHQVPHWSGGARVKGTAAWDGRAWFEGSTPVRASRVNILQQGPVFIDVEVVIEFETTSDGVTPALPLDLGKQVHTWEPNTPPREDVPKRAHAYEARLRFVMGDPWIEVNERFHLPRDPSVASFGMHQYWMSWGDATDTPSLPGFRAGESMPVDTVTWVRWFLYDDFGGNTNQQYVKAEPRPDQKGRPFALLRPRWNQGGGGAQDFILTSGGTPPASATHVMSRVLGGNINNVFKDKTATELQAKIAPLRTIANDTSLPESERLRAAAGIGELLGKTVPLPDPAYRGDAPAAGIIAAFASKWVAPFPNTLAAYANDGNRGRVRFPLTDGERSGLHYGQRAYALCIGPRSAFHNLNNLVRRHTDWTLVAQTHKYILEWKRDPAKAGPHAYITRERLEDLRNAFRENRGLEAEILREEIGALDQLLAQKTELQAKLTETPRDQAKPLQDQIKGIDGKLNSTDMSLLRLIARGETKSVNPITAQLWIERRYQDDFLNPTQRAPRNIPEYATADLFADGKPIGGPWHAALGYITTDLDSWPGWHQGWSPGNPNFHTDKYMGAIYIATALRDHPHSDAWLQHGWTNFQEDMEKVLLAPDGAGYECPGYSGYSLKHQLDLASIFVNVGFGNPVVENPLFKGTGRWHRKLITPFDPRIERRHAAPIGDTHRWDSGFGHGFGKLATFYAKADPAFASEMQGTWKLLTDNGLKSKERLRTQILDSDPSIPPMDPLKMDWSSEVFHGFGALLRNNFGSERESFLSFKAGPLQGHYHNDENSYHFYSGGRPVSLDYNCSYAPRGDHAALHNSMTFGRAGAVPHNQRQTPVETMEQIFGVAWPGAFASTPEVDLIVAERKASSLTMSPVYPADHEFNRGYPTRNVDEIVHRRFLAFVKHPVGSPLSDYLVVRDETRGREAQAVNIHLLAREMRQDGNLLIGNGQYDMDMAVYVAESSDLRVEHRSWSYNDEWMLSPGEEYEPRVNESSSDWAARMEALKKQHNVKTLPLPGWKPRWKNDKSAEDSARWQKLIRDIGGKALMPPPGWSASWMYGEYQHWLRLNTAPGTPVLWVLYPYAKGTPAPTFETIPGGVRVVHGGVTEEILLGTAPAAGVPGQAVFRRNGRETLVLPGGRLPALGNIERKPLAKN